jgi:hypothetical protein
LLRNLSLAAQSDVKGGAVRLAEALSLRAENARQVERLRTRIVDNARYQEGESPAENATELLGEVRQALDDLESLISRINRTNAATSLGDGTMTDALARRDVLRLRYGVITGAADAAAGRDQRGYGRQLRSELRFFSALSVGELRSEADALALELRELDALIQRRNWEVELLG